MKNSVLIVSVSLLVLSCLCDSHSSVSQQVIPPSGPAEKEKKTKIDFNTQMGQCRACIDECGMEGEQQCDSYFRQVASFHLKNFLDNKIDLNMSLAHGNTYAKGCNKKAVAADLTKASVVKLCCMGSGMFQDQTSLKIDYNKKKDSEVIEKDGNRVKLSRCIMCNSVFQDVFTPENFTPSKTVCPKNYVFAGRLGVSDKEQLLPPKEAQDYKESDVNNLEMFNASQQSIMVPFKMKIPHYAKCQEWDLKDLPEKEHSRKLNIFDGYPSSDTKKPTEDKPKYLANKVVADTIFSYGYNLCCNPIDDSQKQSLCEICTSCDALSQETVLVFNDQREEGQTHIDKTSIFKGDCCRDHFGRSIRNIDAVSVNIDESMNPDMFQMHKDFKSSLSLCCQKTPRLYIKE